MMVASFRPPRINDISDLDLAWLAGLLEGEGSFFSHPGPGRRRLRLQVGMCDLDVIDRVHAIVGTGARQTISRPGRKLIYQWTLCAMADAHRLMTQLRPQMSERRQGQIDEALSDVAEAFGRMEEGWG